MAWQDRLSKAPSWLVQLLNLPTPEAVEEARARRAGRADRHGQQPAADTYVSTTASHPAANPYLTLDASANSAPPVVRASTRLAGAAPAAGPWQPGSASRRAPLWQVLLRVLVVIVLVLLILTGIRQWFFRPNAATSSTGPAALPAGTRFPDAAASGLATRFATAYLTWDATRPDARSAALAASGWGGDPEAGWDRKGKQEISGAVTVLRVDPRSDTEGSVTVTAQVVPWITKDDQLVRDSARTVGLRIPIAVTTAGDVAVAALPAIVAAPAPAAPGGIQLTDADDKLGRETRDSITNFFTTYGRDSDLTALAAPGAEIRGLGGALSLVRLAEWTVAQPTGRDETSAVARVVWKSRDGAQLEQTYTLTLRLTTSGDVARWQVYAIL